MRRILCVFALFLFSSGVMYSARYVHEPSGLMFELAAKLIVEREGQDILATIDPGVKINVLTSGTQDTLEDVVEEAKSLIKRLHPDLTELKDVDETTHNNMKLNIIEFERENKEGVEIWRGALAIYNINGTWAYVYIYLDEAYRDKYSQYIEDFVQSMAPKKSIALHKESGVSVLIDDRFHTTEEDGILTIRFHEGSLIMQFVSLGGGVKEEDVSEQTGYLGLDGLGFTYTLKDRAEDHEINGIPVRVYEYEFREKEGSAPQGGIVMIDIDGSLTIIHVIFDEKRVDNEMVEQILESISVSL